MLINFGPAHPAAHGVLRLILELEGEVRVLVSRVCLLVSFLGDNESNAAHRPIASRNRETYRV
jgi:hypothetical protein